ncbi:VOC family protein [Knoellia subterranea]|uniref:Glyoxalase n=1 Tax=Knoellia subterranea KCTC 19937 TaxID=1385521 RepID=A0A0A0JNB3_9MICO|nr:VOC family protein [Knoellia subterranea]KGN37111.1 glyoxalase [Knoellia subterranea KCTC 19937]
MATHPTKWPPGSPCWIEIMAGDLEWTQRFYSAVLGWEFEDLGEEFGHYTNAHLGGRRVAGISPPIPGDDEWPSVWTTYLASDNVDATAAAAVAGGAQVLMDPLEIGWLARAALWIDPVGAAFGAWEARKHTGYVAHGEHGTVGWVDLATPELEVSRDFYGSVFGLTYEDMSVDEATYLTFTPPGVEWAVGGMGAQVPGDALGPRWCVAFQVDDLETARQRVLDEGGEAPDEPWEAEQGEILTVLGPDGEEFSLMTSTFPPEVGSSHLA